MWIPYYSPCSIKCHSNTFNNSQCFNIVQFVDYYTASINLNHESNITDNTPSPELIQMTGMPQVSIISLNKFKLIEQAASLRFILTRIDCAGSKHMLRITHSLSRLSHSYTVATLRASKNDLNSNIRTACRCTKAP